MEGKQYLKANVRILTFLGFCPVENGAPKKIKFLNFLCKNVFLSSLLIFSVQILLDISRTELKFDELGIKVVNTSLFVTASYNAVYFRLKNKQLQDLFNKMNREFAFNEDGFGNSNMSLINKRAEFVTRFWAWFGVFAGVFMGFRAMSSGKRSLSVPAWYPYDWTMSPVYEWTFFLQIVMNIFMCTSFGQSDIFVAALVYTIIGQFRILESNFRNVVFTALLEYGISREGVEEFSRNFNSGSRNLGEALFRREDNYIVHVLESQEFEEILTKLMKKYIKHYTALLSCCEDTEDFLSPILFLKVQSGMFSIIFIAFTIVTNNDTAFIMALVVYFSCFMIQLAIYSKCGDLLHLQMGCIQDSLYECPWYICSKRVRNLIFLTMIRCRKPIKLTAGKIMSMSLETFVIIMKSTFSYFTVLRNTVQPMEG